MAQTVAIERVDHIGIRVRNLDRALAFYRVLGFALVRRAEATMSRSFATSAESSSISYSTPMPAILAPTF
jgi:catechol 2,3-dioxygenase-like lactoylglutathione lyase family enzyme